MRELHPGYKCVIPQMLECLERADCALSEVAQAAIALLDETSSDSVREFCHRIIVGSEQIRKNITKEKNKLINRKRGAV